MKLAIISTLAASTAAFAPSSSVLSKSALSVKPANKEVGVLPPIGFFDPLDLINNGPYGSPEENFKHYRGVEVKHGRIAMAATLGTIVQETTQYQGFLSPSEGLKFSDVPNGLAALDVVPLAGWVQIALLIGAHEVLVKEVQGVDKAPGNFGTGYLGFTLDDQSAAQLRGLNVEIQNGRLAMLGILGMW
eukprot:CAMPEP_0116066614 /NCGR_PEP_ID=MMETSP0322-20121206/10489_1 /TAXON_ID=163516 /ORGANISM="Leptocylindrus danicus var. apora, Strain B651" /LENGTH=188 /DNA_ID=CAMNT_0003553205 /DNA_START=50 /DNA_END=613 /DNA_ORIENTATION=+